MRVIPLLLCLALCTPSLLALEVTDAERGRRENLIAAITDPRGAVNQPAMDQMIALGSSALGDLEALALDKDVGVRSRVAVVAAGIGGAGGLKLLLRLAEDGSGIVRQMAGLGIGRVSRDLGPSVGDAPLKRLRELLSDGNVEVREAAALSMGLLDDPRALGDLAEWRSGGPRAYLNLPPGSEAGRQLDRVRKAMQEALYGLANRPQSVPALAQFITTLRGERQIAIIEASGRVGDPRLCLALVTVLGQVDLTAKTTAAAALSANGDSRALESLVALASGASDETLREVSAKTLRWLTGHQAQAGVAWQLWWRDHAAQVAAQAPRDAFIATLYDASILPTRANLALYQPSDLQPLVAGALGGGPPYWAPLAWRALQIDDAARWTPTLLQRIENSNDERERCQLITLIDGLKDPAALPALQQRLEKLSKAREERRLEMKPRPDNLPSSEIGLLKLVLERVP